MVMLLHLVIVNTMPSRRFC